MQASDSALPSEVPGVDIPAVSAWLSANVDGAAAPFSFGLISGGHSNLTYGVADAAGHRYVLRRPPLGHVLPSAHDMGREHRIISALGPTAVPVAPALGFTDDTSVNGAPFYVMGYVDGVVIRDKETAESALTPDARRVAAESIIETLAAIHAVDPAAVGLGDLGRHDAYIARQLKRWYTQWNASKTRDLPAIDEVHASLEARIPEQGPAAIVHGDYRLDNCMVGPDGALRAVFDWELCTLGDPLADVGMLQVYWTGPDDEKSAWAGDATRATGFPNRAALLDRYADASGRDLADVDFYITFAFWKLACILEGVYARYVAGAMGELDPSHYDHFRITVERAATAAAERIGRSG
jgi:aminoglycoside phosphotransferase (APT) family kinase protein